MTARDSNGAALERSRQAGLRLTLDDFGIGYSSLSYLATRPVNRLKIARQIVAGLSDPSHALVVRTAVRLARELGIELIADGVDSRAQADALAAAGCAQAQGKAFGEPATAARAAELLRAGRSAGATTSPPKVVTAA
jgi:EAL domain-containing protein (putative c-di-GMP-specific phosphodiesterase class I)